jgi:hypothetical protein
MAFYQVGPFDEWPDTERVVVAWLTLQLPDVPVQTEVDDELADSLPLLQVQMVPGGANDGLDEENLVDVTIYASDRASMWTTARRAQAAMLRLSTQTVAGATVDWVSVDNGAGEVPYSNPAIRRAVGTYRITTRAQTTAV